ncbi:transcobalamin 2 S homeolog precursor [Xenopus laevis]|uniref:Transcobalamin-2 n=4 Tax=Xenopus laevis TaxID=8355 RepID=A0A974I1S8_XENLA|nr:transcobalamin 2 S homeolog precursor [Xenopus laevis]OCT98479.1 hypothetical protein XELAEV_18010713mg [Xenopus laevis]
MAYVWLGLAVILQSLLTPVKLCEIPEGHTRLIRSLNLKLLRSTVDNSGEPNPSIYIGLRLSEDHSLEREADYLKKLKTSLETITACSKTNNQEQPSTGILALYLMALKASCEDMEKPERMRLITRLKHQLHKEKKQIIEKNHPLTNYFQYSLGLIALCIHGKKVDEKVIQKLINVEKKDGFVHGETLSVDTEAMAGLAFLCLKSSDLYLPALTAEMNLAIDNVKQKIIKSKTPEGALGNIYSTPLAVQFLSALGTTKGNEECPKAINALIEAMKQGKFSNPMMMSQLMPVLHQKSYLDVANIKCTGNNDNLVLNPNTGVLPDVIVGEDRINIIIRVESPSSQTVTFGVEAPARSSLLDILKSAEKQNGNFMFKTKDSLHGPFLTMVNGVTAALEERTYWQLLKEPNNPLEEGVADYRPEDGEIIILRLSKW